MNFLNLKIYRNLFQIWRNKKEAETASNQPTSTLINELTIH